MSKEQVERVSALSHFKNYVPPVDDYEFGGYVQQYGLGRQYCSNDIQRKGFDDAERKVKEVE
jgi:hypothetical protein